MGSNNIFIREYLESLKEDTELDYLFPILLNTIGFRIVSTAKESKGQSQYGKDIIAIGSDESGQQHRYYFELKGHADRDITDKNFFSRDGIRESIIESKDTAFSDSSIPEFNQLPIKVVIVHNGTLKANIRPTFEGFISKEFKEGQFERWDIYHLTDLFAKHLFNEYLLTDEQSLRLFKKTLVLLDAPENDFHDFKSLVDLQIDKISDIKKGRAFSKFFATQNLLASVVFHYSELNDNLEAAKQCLTYLLLKTWAWILRNKLEARRSVKKEFSKLIGVHYRMLHKYFEKTIPIARLENGLFSEQGGPFEEIGYPLRCFEYLNYLIYFFEARLHFPNFSKEPSQRKRKKLRRIQKDLLIEIITNNDGCNRPILDYHSISILNVVLFLLQKNDLRDEDLKFVGEYLFSTTESILIINTVRGRFPLVGSELDLVKKVNKGKIQSDPDPKNLPPTLLITILFEFSAILSFTQMYDDFKDGFKDKINLQTAYPHFDKYDIEQLLFEKHFGNEFYVETGIEFQSNINEFKEYMKKKENDSIEYRTDASGFGFLRKLAHVYFKNEYFVDEWRSMYD
ncbi:MAG: hypothetical protein ABJH72_24605 [Reichenbachiella sp.]|uniref:hypothetical protein n=1 Tax=Reichenbachiella sp. TaxID=2184521 RepID=UPI003267B2C0